MTENRARRIARIILVVLTVTFVVVLLTREADARGYKPTTTTSTTVEETTTTIEVTTTTVAATSTTECAPSQPSCDPPSTTTTVAETTTTECAPSTGCVPPTTDTPICDEPSDPNCAPPISVDPVDGAGVPGQDQLKELPFTGLDPGLAALSALASIALGVVLARRHDDA